MRIKRGQALLCACPFSRFREKRAGEDGVLYFCLRIIIEAADRRIEI